MYANTEREREREADELSSENWTTTITDQETGAVLEVKGGGLNSNKNLLLLRYIDCVPISDLKTMLTKNLLQRNNNGNNWKMYVIFVILISRKKWSSSSVYKIISDSRRAKRINASAARVKWFDIKYLNTDLRIAGFLS